MDENPYLFNLLREGAPHTPTEFVEPLYPLRDFPTDVSQLEYLPSLRELHILQPRRISSSSSDNSQNTDDDHSVHSLISWEGKNSRESEDNSSYLSEGKTSEAIEDDLGEEDLSEDDLSEFSAASSSQSYSEPIPDEVENEPDWDNSRRNWDLVRHSTISQDQTAASTFYQDQLLVLQSSPNEREFKTDHRDRLVQQPTKEKKTLGQYFSDRETLEERQQRLMSYERTLQSRTSTDQPAPLRLLAAFKMESQDQDLAAKSIHLQNSSDDILGQLKARIGLLEQENFGLRELVKNPSVDLKLGLPQSPRWQVLYRLSDAVYLGEPTWIVGHDKILSLCGALPLADPAQYFQRHKEIAFVVYKTYSALPVSGPRAQAILEEEVLPPPRPEYESLRLISDDMVEAFDNLSRKQTDFKQKFPDFDPEAEILAPYLFWYYYRSSCSQTLQELSPPHLDLMKLLAQWIDTQYGQTYIDADARLSQGFTNRRLMTYLVRPGDVLISRGRHGHKLAYMATSWAADDNAGRSTDEERGKGWSAAIMNSLKSAKDPWVWKVQCWSYGFDGTFYKKASQLDIKLRIEDPDGEVDMKDLNILPLRFASEELKRELTKRGEIFWSCRRKRFVSYHVEGTDELNNDGERFMIDFLTYKKLHADSPGVSTRTSLKREEIPAEIMALETPPSEPELLLFPPSITGYNLRRKKWVDLAVDQIIDVAWNKRAFDNLVVDEETKELIQALVNNKLAGEKSTDLISGKGNGLIILLHGGPGTGKTFTAESVAEMAEKPLYRVTCGDIGTQPEAVEKYLESVLHLGKIWDCVVLLDEADVFLEERGLADLQRNALVSVFLRVLEYYDGILILTSNRVGTFDEAFKSRIQLALHYENLTVSQRKKIWRNFINRLKSLDDQKIDFDDIDCYIDELADHEMNGRQIRNAITTARQLAQYKEKNLSYTHLKHVIGVAGKFDKYLKGVKEGFTDDQIARGGGLR